LSTPPPPQPSTPGDEPASDPRRHAPATLRNRDHILPILLVELPQSGRVVEIASGSGEHVIYFAGAMPQLHWQPSDPDPAGLASIRAYGDDAALPNVAAPLLIDAAADAWPVDTADAVLCINMVHISPWAATVGLFAGAARILPRGAPLILYGPFIEPNVPTAASNLDFDASLRDRNPGWGLRDLSALDALAAGHGFTRTRCTAMPANNLLLVWRR
jgi:hypothetical protein